LEPDLILLTETWCNENVTDASLAIENYRLETDLRRDRNDTNNGIGGGLLVYAKENLRILPCDSYSKSSFNQFCVFTIATNSERINIILSYRPPSSGPTNTMELCEIIRSLRDNTIIIGDINMPGINWIEERADAKGRELMETVLEEGLQQLVSFPTHTKGNILDLVITNCQDKIVEVSDAGRLGKSDHCMLNILVECEPQRVKETGDRYVWSKANTEQMRQDLDTTHWREELEGRSMEQAWDFFATSLRTTIDRNVPKGGQRTKMRNPWMTREILRLVRKKRRKWKNFKHSASRRDEEEYKQIEKETAKKIRNAKRSMEKNLVKEPDKNNRKFSKYVKSKTKSKTTIGPLITADRKMITGGKEMAEELNRFFASVFSIEDSTNIPEAEEEEIGRDMTAVRISEQDVARKIRKLRKDAAMGPDGISPRLLQQFESSLIQPLEILFNKSISTGEVPSAWKTANVTPIFKKGTKGDPGNYRPVSLTSVPCKLLESVLKDKIMSHLLDNNLIKESQHGFMPGRSCATNLVEFLDFVTKAVDDGKAVDIFYLDFAKAFDKVPRQRLIRKLRAKGVSEEMVKWIEQWLTGRTQKVSVQGEYSETCDVDSGVPQGTVLGPILFSVFIDDLEVEAVKRKLDVLIIKFADDTKGAKIIMGPEDCEKLQQALDCMCDWADKWGMAFNFAKCKVMHVGKNNPNHEYFMRGVKIGTTEEERDIGVVITKNLKPSAQCAKAAGRASSVLNQIGKNFHYRDRHVYVKMYQQYVRPHLEFSTPAWSPWLVGDREKIEKVQERAVKMVAGLAGQSYEDKCSELGLESLQSRRDRQDMALVHKYLSKDKQELFTLAGVEGRARTRQTAGTKALTAQFAKGDIRKNSFTVRAVDPWNKLPESARQETKQDSFKRQLKKDRR